MLPALLVAVLSFGGFVSVATIVSHNTSNLTPVSLAKDGGDDEGDDHEDEDNDEDKNEDEGDDDKSGSQNDDEDKNDDKQSEAEKKAEEAAKKRLEQQREAAKKAAETSHSGAGEASDDENSIEDENESEGNNGDEHAMFKDDDKTVTKLEEEIAKTEKKILEKQAEGVDVTAALARLAQAKTTLELVKSAFESNDLARVKELSKEVMKLAHFAWERDIHDAREVVENVFKVEKRIVQTSGKITLLKAVGGDTSSFETTLTSYENDLANLKATIATGNYSPETMSAALEDLERKIKRLKSSVEAAIYALGGTDSKLDDDYENESDDIAEHLKGVAEIEGDEVGEAIHKIASDHKEASKEVGELVNNVDQRSVILQTLFGANEDDLKGIESQIAANKTRVETLTQAANNIEDADVKAILLDQIAILKEQTSKLETFVSGQRDRLSAFGWFLHLF